MSQDLRGLETRIMSSCKGAYLLERGRSAFKIYLEHSSFCINRKICTSRACRGKSGREASGDANQDSDESSKSSHQNYHRRSYERKRNDYQKGKGHGKEKRAGAISFMANPSITHYQRLSIEPSANLDTIKSAYYSLSKQYHPDIVGKDDPHAIENFRLITDAYDTLSNPQTKAEYDKQIQPDTAMDPVYTAWKPQGFGDLNQETVYRMREAHRIFQSKQEEALAREKERNPNKFRCGVFRQDVPDIETDRRRLDNQINSMNAARARNSSNVFRKSDGNEFYRVHLYDTLLRKQQDLREHERGAGNASDDILWISLGTIVGALALLALTAAEMIYDFDLAALLDSRLEAKTPEDIDVKREH